MIEVRTPNKPRIRLWVAALRSGEYQQGSGALHRRNFHGERDTYCCKGVACDLAMRNGLALERAPADKGHYWLYNYNVGNMPVEAMDWYGLHGSGDGTARSGVVVIGHFGDLTAVERAALAESWPPVPFLDDDHVLDAATANDAARMPFTRIADLIENYYQLLED